MRHDKAGFLLITSLLVLTGLATLVAISLSRSMTDLMVTNRFVGTQQAFHLAEAGFDEAFWEFTKSGGDFLSGEGWTDVLPNPSCDPCPAGSTCRWRLVLLPVTLEPTRCITVIDPAASTPTIWAVGLSAGTQQRIQAIVQRPTNGAFKYAIAAKSIDLKGKPQIGNLGSPTRLYLDSTGMPIGGDLSADAGVLVYTQDPSNPSLPGIDFYNPNNYPLGDLCPRCTDSTIFFPPFANLLAIPQAPRLPNVQIDLKPYYEEAIRQCIVDGNSEASCRDGTANSSHHITADKTIPSGTTLNGVIYVERNAALTLQGNVTINGTIVHEGGNWGNINVVGAPGGIKGYLIIDSKASNPYDSSGTGKPFAPGMAMVGAPRFGPDNTTSINITGFVMHDSTGIAADGTVRGGLVAVRHQVVDDYPEMRDSLGPGSYPAITFQLDAETLSGPATVRFEPLPGNTQGVSDTWTILLWQYQ